jgi:hypothetical protein
MQPEKVRMNQIRHAGAASCLRCQLACTCCCIVHKVGRLRRTAAWQRELTCRLLPPPASAAGKLKVMLGVNDAKMNDSDWCAEAACWGVR